MEEDRHDGPPTQRSAGEGASAATSPGSAAMAMSEEEEEERRNNAPVAGGEDENQKKKVREVSVSELVYAVDSFNAIYKPVLLTMILSALAVIYINTPESKAEGEAAVSSSYNVYGDASTQSSTGGQVSAALVNSLVIVSVICAMTFVIVVLYKYRWMKILITYMVLATGMLLGYISSIMFQVAIDRYSLTVDKISFWLFIYNFAIVGTLAIYFGRGFPHYVQQGYLIANSVIVAWQLSYFDPWTAWALLVMLALYDLFAVLSPCGPLKALVKLMQRDNAPDMPGLLYEANLPQQSVPNQRRGRTPAATTTSTPLPPAAAAPPAQQSALPDTGSMVGSITATDDALKPTICDSTSATDDEVEVQAGSANAAESSDQVVVSRMEVAGENSTRLPSPSLVVQATASGDVELTSLTASSTPCDHDPEEATPTEKESSRLAAPSASRSIASEPQISAATGPVDVDEVLVVPNAAPVAPQDPATAHIPLALARMYKLRLVDNPRPRWLDVDQPQGQAAVGEGDEEDPHHPGAEPEYTPEELHSLVHVVFPTNGGRIRAQDSPPRQDGEPLRYDVLDRHGVVRRTLVVRDGKVFRVVPVAPDDDDDDDDGDGAGSKRPRSSIKLGLGDFIFYSILVAEAAVYSYTTFCACTLVIIDGLGMTLFLLAVYGKALPALPISIFLGVVFYLLTRDFIQPWIQSIFVAELYV